MDLRSSIAALVATVVRVLGAGTKAAADAIKQERMASFMVVENYLDVEERIIFMHHYGT